MKFRLFLCLVPIFFCLSLTTKEKASITIHIQDCRETSGYASLYELTVLKNGKTFKELKPNNTTEIITELDTGTYALKYRSIFNKQEEIIVRVNQPKNYEVELCVNYLNYSKETFKPRVDQLKENESFKVIMKSDGCFHSTSDELEVVKKSNGYKAILGKRSKILNLAEMEIVRRFEMELSHMNDPGGCTTMDTYVVIFRGKKETIKDGTCHWNGNYYLKKQLFGVD